MFKEKPYFCKFCGETDSKKFYFNVQKDGRVRRMKSYCKACHNKYIWDKKREYKEEIVKEFGGKCNICGYNSCIGALEFHHKSGDKNIELWHKKRNRGIEYYREQVQSCLLLCANCHREIHYNN